MNTDYIRPLLLTWATMLALTVMLVLAVMAFGGTRTETTFSQFTVCVQGNPISGGVNHVFIQAGINLDNGDPSRLLGKDVLSILTTGQKAAAVNFFNSAFGVVSSNEQVPTPTNMPTP